MSKFWNRFGDYLLQKALAAECKQAGLITGAAQLSFGTVAYLRSKNRSEQSSEAIVMLHGAAADKTSWTRFAKYLGHSIALVIPDLPGHGNSIADINLCYSIHAQAEGIKELIATLGIKRVHLIGNSMGGAIAMHLASGASDLVASLVLIDAAGVEVRPSWLRQHVAQTGINPMITLRDVSDFRAMMRIGMANPPYIPGIILSALARAFIRRNAINQKIAKDIEQDMDQTESLAKIVAPALIIWGAADKVVHVDNAEFLHQRLANSRKIVMDGIGHVPMVEAPQQVAAACSSFLTAVATMPMNR
jgi:abhydrolase domain-containing protein 6